MSLTQPRLDPELERQLFGYWFGPHEALPSAPIGRPTGAVLLEIGKDLLSAEIVCLDLVPVENYWIVLSELGRYTYRHTAGLIHGEKWRFVPIPEGVAGKWPAVFAVAYAASLPHQRIAARYGAEAAARARTDARAVQLRLTRVAR